MSFLKRIWTFFVVHFPFGLLVRTKPRHFREMAKVAWENRGQLGYAWRILKHGVCDGCSLGPYGLKDNVISGTHLCVTRLKLLRLNTMDAMPESTWADLGRLRGLTNEQLHALGRVPVPLLMKKGDAGFRRISWEEAVQKAAGKLAAAEPDRMGFFASSRGITNETYYTFQKLARIAGTPHVDSCARLCHAASSTGLKETLGWGAGTCSLKDWIGTDLIVLFGTDLANNQPMTMKYLHYAKKAGTKVALVNPFREPALERYWVPSVVSSAVFGTKIADHFYPVAPGGDIAFISGTLKAMDEKGLLLRRFIEGYTHGWAELEAKIRALDWAELEAASGLPRAQMEDFAQVYGRANTAVIVYSMGLTQHRFGVDNVRAVVNLALSRGNVGREKTGVVPIRGHSGVQGTAECGVDADKLPGGKDITPVNVAQLVQAWNYPIPARRGLRAAHLLDKAGESGLEVLYTVGGNYLETMPDPLQAARSLSRVKLRVHQDIVLNTSALVEPEMDGGEVLVLPAQTRYEQRGGGTSTSTERRIRFTPEIPGRRIGEAKPEWEIPVLIGRALKPNRPDLFPFHESQDVRNEMARVMPLYKGVEGLTREGDWVQWGGERLGEGWKFPNMVGGKARFTAVDVPRVEVPPGQFFLTSRRGKQFNSITYGPSDAITGARDRRAVFFAREDARRLSLRNGDAVRLTSTLGSMDGVCQIGPCRPGHLQAFWPECNVLVGRKYDPDSGEPDYNAFVQVERLAERRAS
ncbi:MAG TPA: molybdopterin-dependent oxidoreductase [Myxococcales bacterium]|nr:molybdopterin-dependent oxidoreductase [Myxococcales bacterium]